MMGPRSAVCPLPLCCQLFSPVFANGLSERLSQWWCAWLGEVQQASERIHEGTGVFGALENESWLIENCRDKYVSAWASVTCSWSDYRTESWIRLLQIAVSTLAHRTYWAYKSSFSKGQNAAPDRCPQISSSRAACWVWNSDPASWFTVCFSDKPKLCPFIFSYCRLRCSYDLMWFRAFRS